jgi:hypothetical protein
MTIEVEGPDEAIHEFPDGDGAKGHEKRLGAALWRGAGNLPLSLPLFPATRWWLRLRLHSELRHHRRPFPREAAASVEFPPVLCRQHQQHLLFSSRCIS